MVWRGGLLACKFSQGPDEKTRRGEMRALESSIAAIA